MERREGARGLVRPSWRVWCAPAARLARRASPLAKGPGAPRALHPRHALSACRSRFACGARHDGAPFGIASNMEYNPIRNQSQVPDANLQTVTLRCEQSEPSQVGYSRHAHLVNPNSGKPEFGGRRPRLVALLLPKAVGKPAYGPSIHRCRVYPTSGYKYASRPGPTCGGPASPGTSG